MTYRIGDTIALPPEPPVGTVLDSNDWRAWTITRDNDGWKHSWFPRDRMPWDYVLRHYGPPVYTLRIVALPGSPP